MNPVVLLLSVLGITALLAIVVYNQLVRGRNEVKNGWNQIDVQLKRRHDLIPNLVETVKGFARHESEVLERVIAARNQARSTHSRTEQIAAESALSGALANVMAVSERYPELKANPNFLSMQEELTSTENKISFARQAYNDAVMQYNNRREVFPNVIFTGVFGFAEEPYWKISEAAERNVPQVKFSGA
jgi:LemA protein